MVQHPMGSSDAISLIYYWKIVVKRKGIIVLFVAVATLVTAVYSLMVTKKYQAQAVIMPISSSKMPAMLDRMGGLAALAGYSISGPSALTQFMVLLGSDTLAEDIVNQYNLVDILLEKKERNKDSQGESQGADMEQAVGMLKGMVKLIDNRKMETITVSVIMEDPKLAATIVNGYVDALRKIIKGNAFTVAKRNRMFIEEQMEKNKKEYFDSWKDLNEYYKTGKIAGLSGDPGVLHGSTSEVVPLPDSETAALDQGLQSDAVQSEINGLSTQKEEVDRKIRDANMLKGVSPQVYAQYITLRNSLLARTGALLAQQYEMSKIEEARNDLSFQVVDSARVPTKRYYPKRTSMVIQVFVVSLILALMAVIFLEYVHKLKNQEPNVN